MPPVIENVLADALERVKPLMDLFARLLFDVARRPLDNRWLEGAIMEIKVVHKLTPPYFLLLL